MKLQSLIKYSYVHNESSHVKNLSNAYFCKQPHTVNIIDSIEDL